MPWAISRWVKQADHDEAQVMPVLQRREAHVALARTHRTAAIIYRSTRVLGPAIDAGALIDCAAGGL
jgi:hypothetical protein